MIDINYEKGQQITIISLIINFILSGLKISVGLLGNSNALIADGINSLGCNHKYYRLSRHLYCQKPKDSSHPYGHGKVEPLTALVVSFLLIFAVFSIIVGVYNGVRSDTIMTPSKYTLIIAAISFITKEILFRKTMKEGKKINSAAIIANAWDHRSDVYSSIGTFIGIALTIYGLNANIAFLKYADSVTAIIVAILILKVAISIALSSINGLMDSALEPDFVNKVEEEICSVDSVKKVCLIQGRYIGQNVILDIIIEVPSEMSVIDAHMISIEIEELLKNKFKTIQDVMIHIEPHNVC